MSEEKPKHWVVVERQGQAAAHNFLGRREPFQYVPFFWTEQYDFGLAYIRHAEHWDKIETAGSLKAGRSSRQGAIRADHSAEQFRRPEGQKRGGAGTAG